MSGCNWNIDSTVDVAAISGRRAARLWTLVSRSRLDERLYHTCPCDEGGVAISLLAGRPGVIGRWWNGSIRLGQWPAAYV
jgi:hypothetical protein